MKGYPLQCSGLENSIDYTLHGVVKSRTQLSDFHFFPFSSSPPRALGGGRYDNTLIPTLKNTSFRLSCGCRGSVAPFVYHVAAGAPLLLSFIMWLPGLRCGGRALRNSWLWPVGSGSLTRDGTQAPVSGAWRPTHWTPGKPLVPTLNMHHYSSEEPARVVQRW